jgi:hypothetical protein
VGPLDAQKLIVETWTVDPESERVNYNTLQSKPQHYVGQPDGR